MYVLFLSWRGATNSFSNDSCGVLKDVHEELEKLYLVPCGL
jgi:hypothetical protein